MLLKKIEAGRYRAADGTIVRRMHDPGERVRWIITYPGLGGVKQADSLKQARDFIANSVGRSRRPRRQ